VLLGGAVGFLVAYLVLALTGPSVALLACGFVLAGVGIGCAETAEHAAVATHAPAGLRGSAFGLLTALQSLGNFAASVTAGILWSTVSPSAAFAFAAAAMGLAVLALAPAARLR
jgi:MFS family permease